MANTEKLKWRFKVKLLGETWCSDEVCHSWNSRARQKMTNPVGEQFNRKEKGKSAVLFLAAQSMTELLPVVQCSCSFLHKVYVFCCIMWMEFAAYFWMHLLLHNCECSCCCIFKISVLVEAYLFSFTLFGVLYKIWTPFEVFAFIYLFIIFW